MKLPNKYSSAFLLFLSPLMIVVLCFAKTVQTVDPCAVPSFTATNITVGLPSAVVVADFNNDGKLDLAATRYSILGRISVLLGNGSGGFSAPTSFTGGRNPTSIAAGDLNGDGNVDLVTGNESNTEGE